MKLSQRYQLFLGLCLLLFLINLFVMNEVATLWNGAESALLWEIQNGLQTGLPHLLLHDLLPAGEIQPFALRSVAPLLLLLALGFYYQYAKNIFGKATVILTLAALAASLLLPNLAKRATGDLFLFATQLLCILSLILYLKKSHWHWQVLFYLSFGGSIWLQPIGSLLFISVSAALLCWRHPQGRLLLRLNPWLAGLLLTFGLYFAGRLEWTSPIFELGWGSASIQKYIRWNLFGALPFIGFLMAGFRETYVKFRKGEELAIINSALLLGALLGQSLLLQLLFAFLVAKQLQFYFVPNYPNQNYVKTGALLHLLFVFGLSFFLMMGGMFQFGGTGFRSGLALGAVYWGLSFVSVIGLYGKIKRLVVGGLLLSGLLATQLFWLQVYPLVESQRNTPKRLLQTVPSEQKASLFYPEEAAFPNMAVYAKNHFHSLEWKYSYQAIDTSAKTLQIIQEKAIAIPALPGQVDTMVGWNDRLSAAAYYVKRPLGTLEKEE